MSRRKRRSLHSARGKLGIKRASLLAPAWAYRMNSHTVTHHGSSPDKVLQPEADVPSPVSGDRDIATPHRLHSNGLIYNDRILILGLVTRSGG